MIVLCLETTDAEPFHTLCRPAYHGQVIEVMEYDQDDPEDVARIRYVAVDAPGGGLAWERVPLVYATTPERPTYTLSFFEKYRIKR